MAGGNKPNALLKQYEDQAERRARIRYQTMLDIENEIGLIAYIISCDDEFDLTHDQAGSILQDFFKTKQDVAAAIVADDDPQLIHTKSDIARRLKDTLGPDNWKRYRCMFPLLKEYW